MMQNSLQLIKNYNKSTHLSRIKVQTNILENLEYIYDSDWDTDPNDAPYEIVTQLMDCYYCLPERPDLAALFCWQAINNSYNQYLLANTSEDRLIDTRGIQEPSSHINSKASKYLPYLKPYYMKITDKTYRYVASYILKGYAIKESGFQNKHLSSSYTSFKNYFNDLHEAMSKSYGYAYRSITSSTLVGNKVSLNINDADKSRKIIHSFSLKLRELIEKGTAEIDLKVPTSTRKTISFSEKEKIDFLLF